MADPRGAPTGWIDSLDYYFVKKAPFQIPHAGREWLVRFGPWIVLILLILWLPALLWLFNVNSRWAYRWTAYDSFHYSPRYWPWMLGLMASFALMILALPGLFARRASGWRLALYAEIVSLITGLLAMDIVGTLIGALVAFYVLFQIRPLYK
ncbi:MAG TPA: hypothetical protein VFV78_08255 [Vicinamibacterales bacterium]|nr:hypothetical protein [Vicinamibacterales bacterium]